MNPEEIMTLEQQWAPLQKRMEQLGQPADKIEAMRCFYYQGVVATLFVVQAAFPNLSELTPEQRQLLLRCKKELGVHVKEGAEGQLSH